MALNMKLISFATGSLLALSFIFYVVSNAVPEWSKYGSGTVIAKMGLWRTCNTISNIGSSCFDIKCPNNELYSASYCGKILAARAFVTLACITSAIATLLLLFVILVTSDNIKRMLLMTGRVFAFTCLVMGIIGIAIGINITTETEANIKPEWGAASIIGIIAIIINFFGAIASLLIK